MYFYEHVKSAHQTRFIHVLNLKITLLKYPNFVCVVKVNNKENQTWTGHWKRIFKKRNHPSSQKLEEFFVISHYFREKFMLTDLFCLHVLTYCKNTYPSTYNRVKCNSLGRPLFPNLPLGWSQKKVFQCKTILYTKRHMIQEQVASWPYYWPAPRCKQLYGMNYPDEWSQNRSLLSSLLAA